MTVPDLMLPIATPEQARDAIRNLLWHKKMRGVTTAVIVLNSVNGILGLIPAALTGYLINHHLLTNHSSIVWTLVTILLFLGLAQAATVWGARISGFRLTSTLMASLREQFISKVLELPSWIIEEAGTGELLTRSSSDIDKIDSALSDVFSGLGDSFVRGVVYTIGSFLVSPLLGLSIVTFFIVLIPISRWYLSKARAAYLAESKENGRIAHFTATTVDGAHTIDRFNLKTVRLTEMNQLIRDNFRASFYTLLLRTRYIPAVEFSVFLPYSAMIILSIVAYQHHWATIGQVVTVGLFTQQLIQPIEAVSYWLDPFQSAAAGFSRVIGINAVKPHLGDPSLPAPHDGSLVIDHVTFTYPHATNPALLDINLTIEQGERLAIVGPSGAGKTTLAKLIAGFDHASSGSITIGGIDVSKLPPQELRRYISLVTQEHHIFLGSIADNVRIARIDATEEQIINALETVQASWAIDLGLDSYVGQGKHPLSAQQAQQIALARVVLADPYVVILDEATSLLDRTSARTVEDSLAAVLQGRTVIAIAHRLYSAQVADRIAVVEHGQIRELGTHQQLVAQHGSYYRLWQSWNSTHSAP